MNDIKRSPFWFWGFIILLILNITAITTMLIVNYSNDNTIYPMHIRGAINNLNQGKSMPTNNKYWNDFACSKEQRLLLASERNQHFTNMKLLKEQLREMQSNLFDELENEESNTTAIKDIKDKIIVIHNAILDENINFYNQLKSELTKEQMQSVKLHLNKRFHHKGPKRRNFHTSGGNDK